jgi:hypothetical protein
VRVDRLQRRFLASLTALAALAAVAQGMSGVTELALYLTPLFLIAAMLLCGRYVAEDRIVRRWRRAVPLRRARRVRSRWAALAEAPPVSRLGHGPRPQRGPPALVGA